MLKFLRGGLRFFSIPQSVKGRNHYSISLLIWITEIMDIIRAVMFISKFFWKVSEAQCYGNDDYGYWSVFRFYS